MKCKCYACLCEAVAGVMCLTLTLTLSVTLTLTLTLAQRLGVILSVTLALTLTLNHTPRLSSDHHLPKAAQQPDAAGAFPLWIADRAGASDKVKEALLEAWPGVPANQASTPPLFTALFSLDTAPSNAHSLGPPAPRLSHACIILRRVAGWLHRAASGGTRRARGCGEVPDWRAWC